MAYEPRSRGMRIGRTVKKKRASKELKANEETLFPYKEPVLVNPAEISFRAANALQHLGSQRFGLPPFAEHFNRWLVDVESVLKEARSALPATNDLDDSVKQVMTEIRNELQKRIEQERTLSAKVADLQRQLSINEREILDLESGQRARVHVAKRDSDQSVKKIREEIDALDARRLKLLRRKPTFLERILGKPKVEIDGTSRSILSKQRDLQSKEEGLRARLDTLRTHYEVDLKPLKERQSQLKEELSHLRTTTLNDALEMRTVACEKLREIISRGLNPTTTPAVSESSKNRAE